MSVNRTFLLQCLYAVLVIITCFTSGFFVCASTPATTYILSSLFGNIDGSSLSMNELTEYAVETYWLTVYGVETHVPLEQNALAHLQDVKNVVLPVLPSLLMLYVATIALGVMLAKKRGAHSLSYPLIVGSSIVLFTFAALGIWGVIDFYSLFASIHEVFFTEGTWTFPSESLLIRMYPLPFWVGMGIVWISVSVLLSGACLVFGIHVRKCCVNTSNYIIA